MATFKVELIRIGYESENPDYSYVTAVAAVEYAEDDEIVVFPSEYEGKPITHFGYEQRHREEQYRYHDWHHPAQGMEYDPGFYYYTDISITPPPHVKRLVFPKTAESITHTLVGSGALTIEIDPENPHLHVVNGRIAYIKTDL